MKTNFKKNEDTSSNNEIISERNELTKKEFEEYISRSGAKGSFMVYRSSKKDEELGLDEL
ncbi:MAG: hypothetical protein QXN55_03900 [Candidatus Nitrosotenuis sp.]